MLRTLTPDGAREIAGLARGAAAARDRLVGGLGAAGLPEQAAERGSRNPTDLDTLSIVQAAGGDARYDALVGAVRGLAEDARTELEALSLVGRGDYAAKEWEAALEDVRGRPASAAADRLCERNTLAQDLEKGLYAVGGA
jgi:hypothetical protein